MKTKPTYVEWLLSRVSDLDPGTLLRLNDYNARLNELSDMIGSTCMFARGRGVDYNNVVFSEEEFNDKLNLYLSTLNIQIHGKLAMRVCGGDRVHYIETVKLTSLSHGDDLISALYV